MSFTSSLCWSREPRSYRGTAIATLSLQPLLVPGALLTLGKSPHQSGTSLINQHSTLLPQRRISPTRERFRINLSAASFTLAGDSQDHGVRMLLVVDESVAQPNPDILRLVLRTPGRGETTERILWLQPHHGGAFFFPLQCPQTVGGLGRTFLPS